MKEPRVYEIGYLLVPQIKEEELDAQVDALRKMITDKGGLPIAEGRPELIDLAYPMSKDIENKRHNYTKGFFGWIKFDVSPEQAPIIKKEMDALKIMIRNLLITTARGDTRAKISTFNKPTGKKEEASVPAAAAKKEEAAEAKEAAPELTEAEVDAKIDELAGEE